MGDRWRARSWGKTWPGQPKLLGEFNFGHINHTVLRSTDTFIALKFGVPNGEIVYFYLRKVR